MRIVRLATTSLLLAALSGCATLPTTGPVGGAITKTGQTGAFTLVEVDTVNALPKPRPPEPFFDSFGGSAKAPFEVIAPGDILDVTIYEVGVRLFAGGASLEGARQFDPGARGERLNNLTLDEQGYIRIPYIGRIAAAGQTTAQLASTIERMLVGKSEFPQVSVTIEQAIGSTVMVGGEVNKPGRVPLTGAHERLLDIISLAGGYRGKKAELVVRIERGGLVSEGTLTSLDYSNIGNLQMQAGDRVEIINRPRTYSILGTANKIDQYSFSQDQVSLAEALAKAGGVNENLSDPAAVFVFRYETQGAQPNAGADRPTVYHLNMMRPSAYLVAQKFMLDDKDVIYIAGASANRPSKLIQIISQLFTPALLVQQITR